jgi:hypothetical protein
MRIDELFENDYNEDLRSEVITLLTAVSAEGITEISTQNLLNDLEQQDNVKIGELNENTQQIADKGGTSNFVWED